MPALIIKPRLILVTQTDDLGWYITSNQQGKMFVKNLYRIVRKTNITPRQFPYCTTYSIPIDLMFNIRKKYLIKFFVEYGYEYLSTKSHCRSAGRVGVMVTSQSTDRDRSSPHAPQKFWGKKCFMTLVN